MGGTLWRYHLCLDWTPLDDVLFGTQSSWRSLYESVCMCVRTYVCVCSLLLPTWPAGPVTGSLHLSLAGHWVLAEYNTEYVGFSAGFPPQHKLFDYFMRTCYHGGVRKGLADLPLIFRYRCNMNE